jgi:hypothetical protein
MSRRRSTPARALGIEHARQCVELRLAGKQYREIGEIVGIDFTVAYDHVAKYLKLAAQQALEGAEQIRQIEIERIDGIYSRAFDAWHRSVGKKSSGDPRYLQIMLNCQDRRAKLLGLDAPEKTDITTDGKPLFTDSERANRIKALLTNGPDLGTDRGETPDAQP